MENTRLRRPAGEQLNRRQLLKGASALGLVGVAAPALIVPNEAKAINGYTYADSYHIDYEQRQWHRTGHANPMANYARNHVKAFTRGFSGPYGWSVSQTLLVRHFRGGSVVGNALMNLAFSTVDGRYHYNNFCIQQMPLSFNTNSLSQSHERNHPNRTGRIYRSLGQLNAAPPAQQKTGMQGVSTVSTLSKAGPRNAYELKQMRHNASGRGFILAEDYIHLNGSKEWRYVVGTDTSSTVATRFYAIKDAARTRNSHIGLGLLGIAGGIALVGASAFAEGLTFGASTAGVMSGVSLIGASSTDMVQSHDRVEEAVQRYQGMFESEYNGNSQSGYLRDSDPSSRWNAAIEKVIGLR